MVEDVHQTFQNQAQHRDLQGQSTEAYVDELVSAHRDELANQTGATHFSAPVVVSRNPACVCRDGRPCYVVIMHSTHKLTPEVHIIQASARGLGKLVPVDLGDHEQSESGLAPPTHPDLRTLSKGVLRLLSKC